MSSPRVTRALGVVCMAISVLILALVGLQVGVDLPPTTADALATTGLGLAAANLLLCGVGLILVRLRRAAAPAPPQRVRAVYPDGREVPLELTYAGSRDGLHQWEAVFTLGEAPQAVLADELPPNTAILISWVGPLTATD